MASGVNEKNAMGSGVDRQTAPEEISKLIEVSVLPGQMGGRKNCRFCKPKGYTFLPLRYAVVCNAPASQWPDLASTLGANVTDKALGASRYAVRLLREGYLYVLVERKRGPQWQGYAVTPGGMLAQFPIGYPPPVQVPFTCDLATDGVGASLVSIDRIEEVSAIHMLFSPDIVPAAMLDQRAKDRLGMQTLSPKAGRGQAHTLQANELTQWVAEFKLNKDGVGEIDAKDPRQIGQHHISRQLYPLMGGPGGYTPDFDAHGQRLTNLLQRLEETKSPAIVLWDPIGITQELNRSMRAVEEDVERIIKPREWELQTSFRIEGLKKLVIAQAGLPPRGLATVPQFGVAVANPEYAEWKRDPEKWAQRQQAEAWSIYEQYYDEAARLKFVDRVNDQLMSAFEEAERHFTELKPWLTCAALLEALEWYGTNDERCGVLFEYQVSLCTYGLGLSKGGQALLKAWATDMEVRPSNLINRQFLFNQRAAIEEFRRVASHLQGHRDIHTTTLQSMVSSIAGTFDKASAIAVAADEAMPPHGMGGVAAKFVLGAQFYSTIGQSALQPASGAVTKFYAFLLYLRGGAKDFMQGMADMVIGTFDAAYGSKVGVHTDEAKRLLDKLRAAAADKRNANFASLRLGTALGLVEAWNLALKWKAFDGKTESSRQRWELYAAMTATSGAVAISAGHLVKIVRNGSPWVSHLSLASGVLGGFAAGVMAVQAFGGSYVALGDDRISVAGALFVKGVLNSMAAAGSVFVGVLYSGPLLERVGHVIGKNVAGNWMAGMGTLLKTFAARRLPASILGGIAVRAGAELVVGVVGWVLILYQVIELALTVTAEQGRMNVWLMRCRFCMQPVAYRNLPGRRRYADLPGRPYASQAEEELEFQQALQSLIAEAGTHADERRHVAGSISRGAQSC
ncbi:T6SS effector BTH_I2691 family protein [Cupriavidus sp. 2SB]|uniref:T6SS effector BTH_I2691 family protein n=1 Tax=Cupriavidus sp. 2SB TaxID=2502199 RepID=UPI0010F9F612|nr:T6SS effector BTH_I2691 family protein [Cupriavidus sp. 2SB]